MHIPSLKHSVSWCFSACSVFLFHFHRDNNNRKYSLHDFTGMSSNPNWKSERDIRDLLYTTRNHGLSVEEFYLQVLNIPFIKLYIQLYIQCHIAEWRKLKKSSWYQNDLSHSHRNTSSWFMHSNSDKSLKPNLVIMVYCLILNSKHS